MVNQRTELMSMDKEVVRIVISDSKNINREIALELGECWPMKRGWMKRVKRRFDVKAEPKKKKKTKIKNTDKKTFYSSYGWRKLRYQALKLNDGRCELCGRGKIDGIILNVDHIKPRDRYPELELKLSNLQVLCGVCNHGKGNWDETDWRKPNKRCIK